MASIGDVFEGNFGEEHKKDKSKAQPKQEEKSVSVQSESPAPARQQSKASVDLGGRIAKEAALKSLTLPISSMIPVDGEDDAEQKIVAAADKYLNENKDGVFVVEKEKPVYVVKPVGWRHLAGWIVAAFLGGALIAIVGVS